MARFPKAISQILAPNGVHAWKNNRALHLLKYTFYCEQKHAAKVFNELEKKENIYVVAYISIKSKKKNL